MAGIRDTLVGTEVVAGVSPTDRTTLGGVEFAAGVLNTLRTTLAGVELAAAILNVLRTTLVGVEYIAQVTHPTCDVQLIVDASASIADAGDTGTAITLDWSTATTIKVTATGNATITHTNMVAGVLYTLEYYTGAGSFTATFAGTNWASGTPPTLTATAAKLDVFTFDKTTGGTIIGRIFGQNYTP